MKKFKEMHEIVCPFCGDKPLLIDSSINFPEFYCEKCKKELRFETTILGRYFLHKAEDKELCKKHMETYQKDDKDYPCSKCEGIEYLKTLKGMKFTKKQLVFLSKSSWNLSDSIEELIKKDVKGRNDDGN